MTNHKNNDLHDLEARVSRGDAGAEGELLNRLEPQMVCMVRRALRSKPSASPQPKLGGILRSALQADIPSLEPHTQSPSGYDTVWQAFDRLTEVGLRFLPDFRPHVVDTDMFTPTTVVRYTGHANGAIYGAPRKRYDGRTRWSNLFLCGTDQGYVGIIGALTSGIAMANRHLLTTQATQS